MIEWFTATFGPYGSAVLILVVAWACWAVKCAGPIGWTGAALAGLGVSRLGASTPVALVAAVAGLGAGYMLSCLKDPTTRCWVCKGRATKPDGHGNWHMCRWCGGKQRTRFGRQIINAMSDSDE